MTVCSSASLRPAMEPARPLAERWNGHTLDARRGRRRARRRRVAGGCRLSRGELARHMLGSRPDGDQNSGLIPIHPLVERWNGHSFTARHTVPREAGATTQNSRRSHAPVRPHARRLVHAAPGRTRRSCSPRVGTAPAGRRKRARAPCTAFRLSPVLLVRQREDCWAVGQGLNHAGSGSRMIIEHYSGSS